MLALDPGLERVGYALVEKDGSRLKPLHYGLITTPRVDISLRLRQIHREVSELVRDYQPDAMAFERLYFASNRTTGMDVAKAIGCLFLIAAEYELPYAEYSPPQVKQSVVGVGSADKKQVQFMVTKLLSLKETPKPDDVADALAIACTHLMRAHPAGVPSAGS